MIEERQNSLVLVFVAIVALTSNGLVLAQDCGLLLQSGVFDERESFSEDQYFKNAQANLCKQEIRTYEQAHSTANSLGGSYLDIFSANFEGNNARSSFSNWQLHFCKSSLDEAKSISAFQEHVKKTSETLTSAFVKCINAGGLQAWVLGSTDPAQFFLKARYNPINRNVTEVGDVSWRVTQAACTPEPSSINVIHSGGDTLTCRRTPSDTVLFAINSDGGSPSGELSGYQAPNICSNLRVGPKYSTWHERGSGFTGSVEFSDIFPCGTSTCFKARMSFDNYDPGYDIAEGHWHNEEFILKRAVRRDGPHRQIWKGICGAQAINGNWWVGGHLSAPWADATFSISY